MISTGECTNACKLFGSYRQDALFAASVLPPEWLADLAWQQRIETLANALFKRART